MRPLAIPSRERGVTLIELMVALVIGLILSLTMFTMMSSAEGRKRTITATNDAGQAGNYAMVLLDQWLRTAGSGFSKSAAYSFGCTLKAYRKDGEIEKQILPTVDHAALPSPFASVNAGTVGEFRLAPVLILPNQTTPGVSGGTSDVLVIMSGAAGTGGVPVQFSDLPAAAQLTLTNTTAFAAGDLVLVAPMDEPVMARSESGGGTITSINTPDCIIEQVGSVPGRPSRVLELAGAYHSTNNGLALLSDNSSAMVLGNTVGRPPQFLVVGVGDNNTLYSYDLLNTAGDGVALARADGVFELHALYGIDKNCDGKISADEWVSPTDSVYSVDALMAGSMQEPSNSPTDATARSAACATLTTANDYLQKILAIRVGLILRTSLPEKDVVTSAPLTLFSDLGEGLTYTRTLKTDHQDGTRKEQHYRYRTVEQTIPLRNPLQLP